MSMLIHWGSRDKVGQPTCSMHHVVHAILNHMAHEIGASHSPESKPTLGQSRLQAHRLEDRHWIRKIAEKRAGTGM